ncbi:paralemmin-1 isoform X5 [Pogona vitticeps]
MEFPSGLLELRFQGLQALLGGGGSGPGPGRLVLQLPLAFPQLDSRTRQLPGQIEAQEDHSQDPPPGATPPNAAPPETLAPLLHPGHGGRSGHGVPAGLASHPEDPSEGPSVVLVPPQRKSPLSPLPHWPDPHVLLRLTGQPPSSWFPRIHMTQKAKAIVFLERRGEPPAGSKRGWQWEMSVFEGQKNGEGRRRPIRKRRSKETHAGPLTKRPQSGNLENIIETSTIHQERLQAIAEKRKRQTEIENKRRQLEDDRRQLQHLKSKALRERWLLEGTPSSNAEEAEAMKKQMEEDDLKAKELEVSIQRLEKELELLENGISASSTQENVAEEARVVAREEKLPQTPKTPVGSAKVVHAVRAEDGALENGLHQLSSSEVDELIHKADEVTLSEASERVKDGEEAKKSNPPSQKVTPRKEITGVQAKPMESPKLLASGPEPSHEQPVTMIFMGYQNVEDENETKKVLGLEGTIKAELVVIEDAENKPGAGSTGKDHAPPNGSAATDPVTAMPQKQESRPGEQPSANDTEPKGGEQDPDTKKQRCKCCSVM